MPRLCNPGGRTLGVALFAAVISVVAASIFVPLRMPHQAGFVASAQPVVAPPPVPAAPAATLPPPIADVLASGTLIVVSKASQQMHVFSDGVLWQTSPVSTGRRGYSTPAGIFPILQKAVRHRSSTYSGAPMPYMQRLTWRGIAIHGGHLPGYPASHGCIRVPHAFARELYALTQASRTTVLITNQPLASGDQARTLAFAMARPGVPLAQPVVPPAPQIVPQSVTGELPSMPPPARWVANRASPASAAQHPSAPLQTIQLAAADRASAAEAHWARLVAARPELAGLHKVVIPAVVGSRVVYRLRVSAPGAHGVCTGLKNRGIPCFNVS